jgi:hypothetical protein
MTPATASAESRAFARAHHRRPWLVGQRNTRFALSGWCRSRPPIFGHCRHVASDGQQQFVVGESRRSLERGPDAAAVENGVAGGIARRNRGKGRQRAWVSERRGVIGGALARGPRSISMKRGLGSAVRQASWPFWRAS